MSQTRRTFITTSILGVSGAFLPRRGALSHKPNIIYILADDLGYAELGCYGQKKIKTPHIDQLAKSGIRFTEHYSGSPVCAPSRCVLLTGKHTGHAYIRDNDEMADRGDVWHDPNLEGQRPLLPGTETIATILKRIGYVTGAFGKWGLGGPNSTGHPNLQGFDEFFGYLCQRQAHNYYPDHLWHNDEKIVLHGNPYFFPHQKLPPDRDPNDPNAYREYRGEQYSMDLIAEQARNFIAKHHQKPFFLYVPFPVPHAALQVPEDSLEEYRGAFPETPYLGDKGYTPHPAPRACYAAMITRMDQEIGKIIRLLKEYRLEENTIMLFSSDNGPTFNGGTDSAFFESAGPFRGLKTQLYEGGIRVPLIVSWPGHIQPGRTTDHPSAFWDVLPTLIDLVGVPAPKDVDGISFLPTLLGNKAQKKHPALYWEYHAKPSQAVRFGDWKGVRFFDGSGNETGFELYHLKEDVAETTNQVTEYPDVEKIIREIMAQRTESEILKWNFQKQPAGENHQ